jgi:hypothetical protein
MNHKELTIEELRDQLITTDCGGKEWKRKCLDELLMRLALEVSNVH